MRLIKNINIVYVVLLVSAILLAVLAIFYRTSAKISEARIAGGLAIGFAVAVIILRFQIKIFPGSFNNKPTREEIEKRTFGKDETELN